MVIHSGGIINMVISFEKIKKILNWVIEQIYLDNISSKAKNRSVYRGEVYKCNFGVGVGSEMQKERPCLIIQGNVGNINSGNVIVAPITHNQKRTPSITSITTQYDANKNILLDGQVNLSNIQTVSKARLGDYVTKLSNVDMKNVNQSLYVSLGLISEIKQYETKILNLNNYIQKLKK